MKFKISALKEGRFKKEVTIEVPTDQVSKTGATQYEKARFVAEFINVSDDVRESHQKILAELNEKSAQLNTDDDASFDDKNAIKKQIDELTTSFIEKYFVAFEKHPRYPFPFVDDNDQDIASTSENISALLDIRLIREQVADAYNDEVNKHQNQKTEKMIKLLGSNLKP